MHVNPGINKILDMLEDRMFSNFDFLLETIEMKKIYYNLTDDDMVEIALKIQNEDERLLFASKFNLIHFKKILDSFKNMNNNLKEILLETEDKSIMEKFDIYVEKLTSDDIYLVISSLKNEESKIILLEKCASRLSKESLLELIKTLKKDENIIWALEKFNSILESNHIVDIIIYKLKDEKEKINQFERYISLFQESDIADIISFLKNDADKIKLLRKYISLIDKNGISRIIVSLNRDNLKLELLDLLDKKLSSLGIADIVYSIEDDLIKMQKLEKYHQLFDSELFFYIITSLKKQDNIINMMEKYIDNINGYSICNIICYYLDDREKQLELLKKYTKDENYDDGIRILSDELLNMDDKLDLFLKVKNDIKDKWMIIVCLKDNGYDIIPSEYCDKIINLLSPIFDEIDPNCELSLKKYCIEKILQLDIYSILELKKYLMKNKFDNLTNFINSIDMILKLSQSNSLMVQHLAPTLVSLLMDKDNNTQEKIINQIENVFLKNNLPVMAKLYKVFDIMHPNFSNFGYCASPNLNAKNNPLYKQIITFSDLMKITIGSNNRSLKEYVKHIEVGNQIAKEFIYNDINIETVDTKTEESILMYLEHLKTLYNNTLYGKNNPIVLSGDVKKDILILISLFGKNEPDFNIDKLPDRIVKMFGHFAGIDTLDELKMAMDNTIIEADLRNRKRAKEGKFEIHKGDFIKGLANDDYRDEFYIFLTNIFQNGSLCKEFLGAAARSDSTPMDTDVSRLLEEPANFQDAFTNSKYASSRYGPIWIVLKSDDRFNETSEENNKYDRNKLEVFKTDMDGLGYYGIRTGFSSSDIDYLVVNEDRINLHRIKYEIVMNGFYIPLLNINGDLIFTPDEYDMLHENMAGISYYNTENEYKFSDKLDNFDIKNTEYEIDIESSIKEVDEKRKMIIQALEDAGITIYYGRSNNLSDKSVDLIDTGSTGRGTNKMDDYDFDFVMRIDRDIYVSEEKTNELFDKLKKAFPEMDVTGHNIRNQTITLPNGEKIKLDITIIMKTDSMDFSTEECISDRLENLKKMDFNKYKKVLENIVLAKYILKDVYKSKNASEHPQGGLGGVGIENWILQNGGSFEQATLDFLSKAEGKDFKEFKTCYSIWDFGQNNLSFKREDGYFHDEFVSNNMTEEGYNKMVNVLKEYVNSLDKEKNLR